MSSPPRRDDAAKPSRPPVTLMKLAEKRALGEPIVMVTAYDHPSALAVEAAEVDMVLVGDSAANNVLGYPDTVPITVEELLMLSAAVRRGLRTPLMVGDLPFGSYEASDAQAIATAHRFLQEAGCFAIVFEAIPTDVTDVIMEFMEVPIIGIGAGPSTDGQVLVLHDLLAIHQGFKPKFVKAYAEEVRSRAFPGPQHAYSIAPEELERLRSVVRSPYRSVGLTS